MKGRFRTQAFASVLILGCYALLNLSCEKEPVPAAAEPVKQDEPAEVSDEKSEGLKRLRGVDCDSTREDFPLAGTLGEIHMPYTYGVVREDVHSGEPWHSDQLSNAVGELNGSFHGCLREFGLKIEKGDCFVFEVSMSENSYDVEVHPNTALEECMENRLESEQTPNLDARQPLTACIGYFNNYPISEH